MAEQTLKRTLGLGSVVLFGLAYMAPMIVLGTFGVLAQDSAGVVPTAYLLALIAMLFTAISYGRLAGQFPVAGSAYTYSRKAIDSRVGFLVGWAVLLDYFFLPMVIWLIGASYLNAQFPAIAPWIWIVGFIVVTTVLNVLGLQLAAKINLLLMLVQILVLAFFIVQCLRFVGQTHGAQAVLSAVPFGHTGTTVSAIAAGAAVAAYSFLGFDAITTLTEETKNPRRTIPKAIVLVTVIGGVIYLITSYASQLAAFNITIKDSDSAAFEIAKVVGGSLLSATFLAGLVVTQLASGIAAQASAARLLFAMGRDGVLPKRVFGYTAPKWRTPVINIVLIGVFGLIAVGLNVSESTAFINFGAFTAFAFVNLSVFALAIRRGELSGPRNLLINALLPLLGTGICGWLMTSLDSAALTIGPIWLAIGVVYLAVLTKGFRRQPPELSSLAEA
jgi:amino acid transporter